MTTLRPDLDDAIQQEWLETATQAPLVVRQMLADLAQHHAARLTDVFYDVMLADDQARHLLDNAVVDSRLRASMQRWITALLTTWEPDAIHDLMALQRHIGVVHARVDVRVSLVLRGARAIKRAVVDQMVVLHGLVPNALLAVMTVTRLMDLAVELMSSQYVQSHELAARTDEAYRSFASSANMSLERERQRTALLDWESRFLQDLMISDPQDTLNRIGQSSFGLWIQHKAVAVFAPGAEMSAIMASMQRIDQTLLPLCRHERVQPAADGQELRRLTRQVLSEVEQIRFLMSTLFEHLVDMENGRDALTQLLNRRFLPAILSREIDLSRRSGTGFSLLLIDVDHFKSVNDQHGHAAGDRVLQHLAAVLSNTVRSGDFVFRFGGEEFLVISVETDVTLAGRIAEKIRVAVQDERFMLANGGQLSATVSIGVAAYDGHPDYQRLIERADQALYRAKHLGRNCVVANG